MRNITRLAILLPAVILSTSVLSSAQNNSTLRKKPMIENETEQDPYLPNAFHNQRTSPPYKFSGKGITKQKQQTLSGSSITTTQVNVDANGQNILGDAANEPNITVNPLNANDISIGWRQFDNVASNFRQAGWGYTSNGGTTWTFPGVIDPGVFRSDPVLDFDASGNFYYNSLTSTFSCRVYKSTNGGATWDLGIYAGGGDKQWMTIDRTTGVGAGNIYSSWSLFATYCQSGNFTRLQNVNAAFDSCTNVTDAPFWMNMAVGNNGELYIAGADTVNSEMEVVVSPDAKNNSTVTWNTPVPVFMDGAMGGWNNVNPQGLLGMCNVDVDRSGGPGNGNVYVLASTQRYSNGDPGDVMFSRSIDGGLTWSSPMQINDDNSTFNTQWLAVMSVAPNGRIDVAWLDTRDSPGYDSSALYYSYSLDQGNTWSPNEKMSASFDPHVGYPNQSKMGDYFDMISDNTGAHLAWANTLNGEEDVYYSYIVPPVNAGVQELDASGLFTLYPNPGNGHFMLTGKNIPRSVELYNVMGEKIMTFIPSASKSEFDISSFASGVYFVKITSDDGKVGVKKLVLEK